jgi:hypothetical protein
MTQLNDIITDENGNVYASAAVWCNENKAVLQEIEAKDGKRRFQVKAIPEPTIEEKNEQIRQQRQSRFATESDPLYLDYVEAQARGDETVDDKKQLWLDKKDEIRADLPYVVEVKTTTKKRKKASA